MTGRRLDDTAAFWDVASVARVDDRIVVAPHDRTFPGGRPTPLPDTPLTVDQPCLVDLGPTCGLGLACIPGEDAPIGMCQVP